MFSLLLLIFALLPSAFTYVRVVGNLALVARPVGHVGTDASPVQSNVGEFWCGLEKVGEEIPVEYGEFTRLRDGKVFEGTVKDKKAKLHFGRAPATVAGKYLCEVRGEDGQILSGNMFVYSPPVLRLPTGSTFREIWGARPPKVIGGTKTVKRGSSIELRCPVFGYPQPWVRWEKDGAAIEPNPSLTYDGDNIVISHMEPDLAGTYTCIADNSFPMFVDGPSMPHSLVYEQKVVVN
ncbi:unnamed protein product [Cylicocyclus nassatus]|uniref:Ig-like domain-containing protein n=1 Tax=Cylicocyclus nassatus TaxID=53992 RepID=A0AA36GCE1_CYLNA|nr:unnamed protein product [Cylicocyclus nassatus]